ncbi:MAG: sulfite exporter TauE/SafE family protein [Actinomycetota bacterium]|nr:sulfite exporter TauE/SafE family protein [Actinomycetota bacterium]
MSATDLMAIFLAVSVGSTVKGVTGIGLPLTAVPLMSLVIGVEDAVVSMAIPNVGSNLVIMWSTREVRHETPGLGAFVVVGGVTAIGGAWLLSWVPERGLLLALAAMVIAFLVWRVVSIEPHWSPTVQLRGRVPVAAATGLCQGSIGISGPIVAPWFQGHGLGREVFMYANSFVFLVTGVAQVIGLTASEAWAIDRAWGTLAAVASVAIVLPSAVRLGRRLAQKRFEQAVTVVLCIAVVSLIVRAV